jgi:hypothetical protein
MKSPNPIGHHYSTVSVIDETNNDELGQAKNVARLWLKLWTGGGGGGGVFKGKNVKNSVF